MTLIRYSQEVDNRVILTSIIQEVLSSFRRPDGRPIHASEEDVLELTWEEIEEHFADEDETTKKELRRHATQLISLAYSNPYED
jgi:hypothetical protein